MDASRPRPETAAEDRSLATPDALFRAHSQAVFAVCLANTRNHHDAEDIMQAVFLKSIDKVSGLREATKVRAWLVQVARRLCIDFHRRRKPVESLSAEPPSPSSQDAHSQMPIPAVQCLIASSIVSHCGEGCLLATMTLT